MARFDVFVNDVKHGTHRKYQDAFEEAQNLRESGAGSVTVEDKLSGTAHFERGRNMARPKGSKNKVRTINVSGGTDAPRRRRRRDTEPSGVPIIIMEPGSPQPGVSPLTRKSRNSVGSGRRGRRGSLGRRASKAFRGAVSKPLSGGWGVALKLAGAGLGGIAGEAATEYVQATSSTADDKVVGVGKPIASAAFVWIGQKMRGKLQALGEVMEHLGSGLFGQTAGDYTSRKASAAIKSAATKSGSKSGL